MARLKGKHAVAHDIEGKTGTILDGSLPNSARVEVNGVQIEGVIVSEGIIDTGSGEPGVGTRMLLMSRASQRSGVYPLGAAHVTRDGVITINGTPIPGAQLTTPLRVRHVDCGDNLAEVVATFLVSQVEVEDGAVRLVEEVPHHECEQGCVCHLEGNTAAVVDMVNRTRGSLRRFVLQRNRDDTGVSGTGIVAEGTLFSDGRAIVRWCGNNSSIVLWNNLDELLKVHGHDGQTRLRWLDTDTAHQPHPDAPNFPRIGR